MRITYALFMLPAALAAQQVAAPTPEAVGPARGQNVGEYNVVNSFEFGYRFATVGGDFGKYRSDVNYGNGVRLLGSRLTVHSRDGHGRYFDEIVLATLGLGNDPYQSALLRVEKNRLYRYDLGWRLNEYYNPALTVAFGQHLMNTRRRLQDHDLLLLPQSRLKFRLGYSRNSQTGPALTTLQLFDSRGDEFPLFADVKRSRNEYRLGADFDFAGMRFSVLHRWDYYKEDTPYRLEGTGIGNNSLDNTRLTDFYRAQPIHGSSPAWLGNLRGEYEHWGVNARITYVGARRDFILDETAIGTGRLSEAVARQVIVAGDARRPITAGDFSLSLFPTGRLTLVNTTSVYNTNIDGDAAFLQFDARNLEADTVFFRFLGIRRVANATDLTFDATRRLGLYTGYHFSNRRIRFAESFALGTSPVDRYEQENTLHSGLAGVRVTPVTGLALNLEGEIGRAGGPFTPVSEREFHAVRATAQYRRRSFTLTGQYRQFYNNNAVTFSTHSLRSRQAGGSVTWVPRERFAFDAGYTKLHLDSVSGIAFFAGTPVPQLQTGRDSVYVSNIHSGVFGAHFGITRWVDFYAGYNITKDTGDGRDIAARFPAADPVSLVLLPVQTYPLTFDSPLARLSVRITSKVRWNAGYQYYRYHEEFGLFSIFRNYRAHTGYTSILWAF